MEDFFAAVLGALFEILAEALFEFLLGAIAGLLSRGIRRLYVTAHRIGPVFSGTICALAGALAGWLSSAVFPHPLVHPSHFHGISLLFSPLAAGLGMALIGRMSRAFGRSAARIESFGYGFVFALGISLVRFALVK